MSSYYIVKPESQSRRRRETGSESAEQWGSRHRPGSTRSEHSFERIRHRGRENDRNYKHVHGIVDWGSTGQCSTHRNRNYSRMSLNQKERPLGHPNLGTRTNSKRCLESVESLPNSKPAYAPSTAKNQIYVGHRNPCPQPIPTLPNASIAAQTPPISTGAGYLALPKPYCPICRGEHMANIPCPSGGFAYGQPNAPQVVEATPASFGRAEPQASARCQAPTAQSYNIRSAVPGMYRSVPKNRGSGSRGAQCPGSGGNPDPYNYDPKIQQAEETLEREKWLLNLLGFTQATTLKDLPDIRKAKHRYIMNTHPDKGANTSNEESAKRNNDTAEINRAFDDLKTRLEADAKREEDRARFRR